MDESCVVAEQINGRVGHVDRQVEELFRVVLEPVQIVHLTARMVATVRITSLNSGLLLLRQTLRNFEQLRVLGNRCERIKAAVFLQDVKIVEQPLGRSRRRNLSAGVQRVRIAYDGKQHQRAE